MTRAQLEHLIRAAAEIAAAADIVIIGSQAILGQFPDAPHQCVCPAKPTCILFTIPKEPI